MSVTFHTDDGFEAIRAERDGQTIASIVPGKVTRNYPQFDPQRNVGVTVHYGAYFSESRWFPDGLDAAKLWVESMS